MKTMQLRASVAVLAIAAAHPAAAELTAQEVWDQWQTVTAQMGPDAPVLTAEGESYDGGVLTLDGLGFSLEMPEGTMSGRVDRMVLTEQDDGTVAIVYEGDYLIELDMTSETGESVQAQVAIGLDGLEMTASGDPATTHYDYSAAAIDAGLAALVVDGDAIEGTAEIELTGIAGRYTLVAAEPMTMESGYTAAKLTALIDFTDPEEAANSVQVEAEYNGITTTSSGTVTKAFMFDDPAEMFSGDVQSDGSFSHAGGAYTIAGSSEDEGAFAFAASSDTGALEYSFSGTEVAFSMGNSGVAMALSGDQIPLPEVTATVDRVAFGVTTPLAKSDEVKDVSLLLELDGLGVSEMIWAMADPTGALPHDPATLLVAIDGQMRLTADLTDEAAMNAPLPPFDFEMLDLTGLTLAIAGAELTGSGGLDFSQAPEGAVPGMPGVAGAFTLALDGGNGLLETLVAMGLLPQEQAMGFQMMMGMFARPVGEDLLESEIVLGADGSITANGNQLK